MKHEIQMISATKLETFSFTGFHEKQADYSPLKGTNIISLDCNLTLPTQTKEPLRLNHTNLLRSNRTIQYLNLFRIISATRWFMSPKISRKLNLKFSHLNVITKGDQIILNKLRYWNVLLFLKSFVWFNLRGSWSELATWGCNQRKLCWFLWEENDLLVFFLWNPVNRDVSSLVAEIIWISCFLCSWTVPSKYDVLKNCIWLLISSCGLD